MAGILIPASLSNTTVSPMVILPLVGVSSPAIIRRVVVFPQPEGPRRVTKALSAMTMLRSSTA